MTEMPFFLSVITTKIVATFDRKFANNSVLMLFHEHSCANVDIFVAPFVAPIWFFA
jgi:hypothetical protein